MNCGVLCVSCGSSELPRRDADLSFEVVGKLTLVREAGASGDCRQREVVPLAQELLRPFNATGNTARWITRFMMKRLSRAHGHPTDTSHDHELTDWTAVAAFADKIDYLTGGRLPAKPAPAPALRIN